MSDTLLSLTTQSFELIKKILESNGEITPELSEEMENIEAKLPTKIDAYDHMIKSIDSQCEFMKAQKQMYAKAASSCESFKEALKTRIKQAMTNLGRDEINGHSVRFKLSPMHAKLVIDETLLHDQYKMTVLTKVPDKELIQSLLDKGHDVPGARYEEVHALRTYPARKE